MITSNIDYQLIERINILDNGTNVLTRRYIATMFNISEYKAQQHLNLYRFKKENYDVNITTETKEQLIETTTTKFVTTQDVLTDIKKLEDSYKKGDISLDYMIEQITYLRTKQYNVDTVALPSRQPILPNYTPKSFPDFIYNSEKYNFLILPDLHAPFDSPYVLDYIARYIKNMNIDVIISVGDESDFHASSFHATETGALGVEDELYFCKKHLRKWTDTLLPLVTHKTIYCVDSNHSAIPDRKRKESMVSRQSLRSKSEMLELPEWEFLDYLITNNFGVSHGTAGANVVKRAMLKNLSWIIGHYHTKAYLQFITEYVWAMQLSCGFDKDSYAAAYSRTLSELSPAIHTFGIILKGNNPFILAVK